MGYIYLITNTVNDMKYVGQTKQSINYRFRQHITRTYRMDKLHTAMKLLGTDNFSIHILEITNDLDSREAYHIKLYDSIRNGYNTYSDHQAA